MAEPPKKRAKPAAAAAAAKKTAQSSSSYFDDLMRDVSNTHSAMQAVSTTAGSIASAGHQARAASAAVPAGENRAAAIAAGLLAAREAGLALGLDPKTAENELEVEARVGLVHQKDVAKRFFPSAAGHERAVDVMRELKAQPLLAARSPPAFRSGVSTLAFRKASDVARQAPTLRGSRRAALTEQVWVTSSTSSQGRPARVCMVTRRQELPPVGAGVSGSHDLGNGSSSSGAVSEAPRCESKNRVCPPLDLALPACHYDLRVSVMREEPLPVPTDYASSASGTRLKNRESVVAPPHHPDLGCWQLDLTEVTSEGGAAVNGSGGAGRTSSTTSSERSYEVELELTAAGRRKWLAPYSSDAESQAACFDLARQLLIWLDLVNPPEGEVVDPSEPLPGNPTTGALPQPPLLATLAPSDPRATAALKTCEDVTTALRALSGHGGGGGNRHGQFPGAMPVNMFRRHLANLEGSSTNQSQGDYFVTEKTDGERKLLVVVEAGNPPTVFHVLVDRSLRVSSVRPNNVTNSASSSASSSASLAVGTVLDGEVVFNLTLQRHVFMVFDLLRLGGNPANANGPSGGCVVHLPWRQRVSQLPLPALEATQSPHHALPLAAKTFWPASKIDHLFKHMVPGSGHVFRIAPKPGDPGSYLAAHHKTDGVILQPNTPYVMGTDYGLLKWKFLDTVTVDMAVYVTDGEVGFACSYQGGEVDFSEQASLGWEDTARLSADLAALHQTAGGASGGNNRTIAEVGLDPATGTWFYKNLRPDKDRANDLKTVLATLLELAENVGAEELEARLLGCSAAAWDDARRAHAATLVDAQRRRAADQRAAAKTSKKK